MTELSIKNLGQIKSANIDFGDLTLFVGSQATGKSILLQLIKLVFDGENIGETLMKYGYQWEEDLSNFNELYFGEGMRNLWSDSTKVLWRDEEIYLDGLLPNEISDDYEYMNDPEYLFFIPAQRVLTLENGWPRSFTNFEIGDPYVVCRFSEHLRLLMQQGFINKDKDNAIFPQAGRLRQEISDALNASIFHGAKVELNTVEMRKRIQINVNGNLLPFMAWSAGQREFMPLLLGLYWLMPVSHNSKKPDIDFVVIEEPEMGLHPRAILSVILMCLELIHRGYRLLISTHSPVLLEAVWAIRNLQNNNSDVKYLYQLFDLKPSPPITELFENILKNKKLSTYYFDQKEDGVEVRDISSLDPFDEDLSTADWGGLTSFSSRASEVVSQAVQDI
ncbi:AAA family ATPase [Pseudanabaena sp. 'Roaring Creek']|uniref:AAA family ATPase n=1 Tax=Pseudanabaena sp. 'Roaring Creek' TaxID=1681830 RepID=UPI0006D7B1DE|nr:AAA family ATPase [Pseudanabaena sp. 'Roaring Creek']